MRKAEERAEEKLQQHEQARAIISEGMRLLRSTRREDFASKQKSEV
jgi:hypothetical protein